MEDAQRKSIEQRALSGFEHERAQRWVESIDRHVLTGEDAHFYLSTEEEMKELLALVGHDAAIDASKIRAYNYESFSDELTEAHGQEWGYWEGEATIWGYFDYLGDLGIMNEYMNDFQASIVVELDSETAMMYKLKMNSVVVVCEECAHSTDPDLIEALQYDTVGAPKYNCEHEIGEVEARYSAAMIKNGQTYRKIAEKMNNLY